jgi:hypothetical protein
MSVDVPSLWQCRANGYMGTVVVDGSGGVVMDEVSNYYVFDFWVRGQLTNREGQDIYVAAINTKVNG